MKFAFLLAAISLAVLLAACQREQRGFREATASSTTNAAVHKNDFEPASASTGAQNTTTFSMDDPYSNNAYAVSEGENLYNSYNCVGCHAHGGGGMGVPLIDREWIYGSSPKEIYKSIVEGRPNGMPSFGGKIPEQQVWEIVAYVRSMSGQLRKDVAPARSDHMTLGKPPSSTPREKPTGAKQQ